MRFINKYKRILAGIVAGSLSGYAYYYFVGCSSGTCPITSHPLNSMAYGALLGTLLITSFKKDKNENEK